MPKIHYPQAIEQDLQELQDLEKRHRYTHLFQRVRMLRLLKAGSCSNLGEKPPERWATVGASARGGSLPTGRVVRKSF
jgi:hypothetical protein